MTRVQVIRAAVAQIEYEDWLLKSRGEQIWWVYPTVDVNDGEEIWLEGRPWSLVRAPDATLEREVVTSAFLALKVIWEHEVREQFMYGGRRVFDPHARGWA